MLSGAAIRALVLSSVSLLIGSYIALVLVPRATAAQPSSLSLTQGPRASESLTPDGLYLGEVGCTLENSSTSTWLVHGTGAGKPETHVETWNGSTWERSDLMFACGRWPADSLEIAPGDRWTFTETLGDDDSRIVLSVRRERWIDRFPKIVDLFGISEAPFVDLPAVRTREDGTVESR